MRIDRRFFQRDAITAAKELIGCRLVRQSPEGETQAIIVETEAYLGELDDAAHTYKGKTERVRALYGEKGCAYIYLIYGIYNCLNVSAGEDGKPHCILIRALEPVSGIELMGKRRKTDKLLSLCSGPGKLCMAMDITRELYGADLVTGDKLYIEYGEKLPVKATKRIGIEYAALCRDKLWRFTAEGSKFVSK